MAEKRIALCMITGDEGLDETHRIIEKYGGFFDQVCIAFNGQGTSPGWANYYKFRRFNWEDDFAKARNQSFELSDCDYNMWLDTDDDIINPENLVKGIKHSIEENEADVVIVPYDYEQNEQGVSTTMLVRERVVRNGMFYWKPEIHECLCSNYALAQSSVNMNVGYIKHNRLNTDKDRIKSSLDRNYRIQKKKLDAGNMEPRDWFYYGNTLQGMGKLAESIEAHETCAKTSNNPNEVYQCRCSQSEQARLMGDANRAMNFALMALGVHPHMPTGNLMAAEAAFLKRNFGQAIYWADRAMEAYNGDHREALFSPQALQFRPVFLKAHSINALGGYKDAKPLFEAALEMAPGNKSLIRGLEECSQAMGKAEAAHAVLTAGSLIQEPEARMVFMHGLPPALKNSADLSKYVPKAISNKKPRLMIHCGFTVEMWDFRNEVGGIGGSEIAVIKMARLLSDEYHVEVYCHCEQAIEDPEGPMYYPFHAYNSDDEYDVAIMWRSASRPVEVGVNARTMYLWLHDMPVPQAWFWNTAQMYERIFVLSQFHKEQFIGTQMFNGWDHKFQVTSNGLDFDTVNAANESQRGKRKANSFIYASCPSRGLIRILDNWEGILDKDPGATLEIYYGWNPTWDAAQTKDPSKAELRALIESKLDKKGITWHGRVGQLRLFEAFARAQFWLYPTSFPEISCITAMQAQALGCYPITSDQFALQETVIGGTKVHGDMNKLPTQIKFFDQVHALMASPPEHGDVDKMKEEAKVFDWAKVAKDWKEWMASDLSLYPHRYRKIEQRKNKIDYYTKQQSETPKLKVLS